MIQLSAIIKQFEGELLRQHTLLPSQLAALGAMKNCRTSQSPLMQTQCEDCDSRSYIPHSCGHRHCPHCQNHESQQWLERQLQKQVPAEYFLITFTLPQEFRQLAWQHQRIVYDLMMQCSWETLHTFAGNDPKLQGEAGAVSVLHTHARNLAYHPHVHVVMPAATLDAVKQQWRTKTGYLFCHKALAKVFRAKLLGAIRQAGLELPPRYPKEWVVDCKSVGSGEKALTYLGRYLYKGVVQEKDIIACDNGAVTFRYRDNETKQWHTRKLSGVKFLRLLLRHVLPKGFRRARNFGFLHPNSKRLLALLQKLLGLQPKRAWQRIRPQIQCKCCGGVMKIVKTRIPRLFASIAMEGA